MLTDETFIKNNKKHVVGFCDNCGKRFDRELSYANKMQYCSTTCMGKGRTKNALKDYTCENCTKPFQRPVSFGKNRFCSQDCSIEFQANKNRKLITCANTDCNKKLVTTNSKYCSKKCKNSHTTKKFVNLKLDLKTKFLKKPKDYYKKYLDEKGRYTNCVICEKTLDKPYAQKLFCDRRCRTVGGELGIRYTPIFIDKECLSCGKTFQERIGETKSHQKKYCTHDCYLKVNKKAGKRYVSLLGEEAVVYHSGWELRFAATCLRFDIPCRRYDGDPISTTVGDYYPDFIAGENDDIIEIKGYLDKKAEIKINTAHQIFGDRYKILLEEDLKRFEETGELV